jgi:hypothetical protein
VVLANFTTNVALKATPATAPARVLIGIPTSLSLLKLRLHAIMATWGKAIIDQQQQPLGSSSSSSSSSVVVVLKFFVSSSVGAEAQQVAASLGFPALSFVAMQAEDSEYPPVKRNIAMLMEAAALMAMGMGGQQQQGGGGGFDWFLKVDDDTFVDTNRLKRLVHDLRGVATGPHLLGARGHGRPKDRPFLELPPNGFCMGGNSYLFFCYNIYTILLLFNDLYP